MQPEFSWTNRRRWVFRTTTFCMVVISYCVLTESNESAMTAAFTLLGGIGATYVAGATAENMAIAKASKQQSERT